MPATADLKQRVKIAFASGPDDLNRKLIDRLAAIYPELPLMVVSEFPPHRGEWIPYHVRRSFLENFAVCREAARGKRVRLAAVLLVPQMPYRRMRLMALLLSPRGFLAYNEELDSFMLRPRNAVTIVRNAAWRTRNFLRWQLRPGGGVYTWAWRLWHPRRARLHWLATAARVSGWLGSWRRPVEYRAIAEPELAAGVSVVIPSRNGRELLETMLPSLMPELEGMPSEVIVVDNGSDDSTDRWLAARYPGVLVELSATPLSFARAVNRGIERARYSRVCLLNNDMIVRPGFFGPLLQAFDAVPYLFCATAQIFFPPGVRREETGKCVMRQAGPADFPVRCDDPIPGEDGTWVLYGSGGCSLYAAGKLRALGGVSEIYEPAYVEDLDLGYRAWLRGWPTVFVSKACVEHRHRATTSRYYSEEQLSEVLEVNYLRFLAHAVESGRVFWRLWRQAIRRLELNQAEPALEGAWKIGLRRQGRWWLAHRLGSATAQESRKTCGGGDLESLFRGDVAVFPGRASEHATTVLIATPYLPFPLSHGGAVRMFNLMSSASKHVSQILVSFCDQLETPPPELLEICREIVLVRRTGSHLKLSSGRPDVVEEFDQPAFHMALRESVRKWRPAIAQLEFTQMAVYAADCAPSRTILVEHDITFDLYEQLLRNSASAVERLLLKQQLERWRAFETNAWKQVDCVVMMSEKDRQTAFGARRAVSLPNGVDTERFTPSEEKPEPGRLLFIGSFAHLPNLLAIQFFLREIWPRLHGMTLHIGAGKRHEEFLLQAGASFDQTGVEIEGFVADVRPAYRRAEMVIAPLIASAGTNIKILEAMAMGKAVVGTRAGFNGLDLTPGEDVVVAEGAVEFAAAIERLHGDAEERSRLGSRARLTVCERYEWREIGDRQREVYREIGAKN